MAKEDSGYFGVRLGEALATGASHISEALQRKYAMQRRDEEMARQREEEKAAQNQATRLAFAKAGIDYDSENPAAAFEAYRTKSAGDISTEDRLREAQIKRTEFQSTPEGQHGGMESGPYQFFTGPGGIQYVRTKYGPKAITPSGYRATSDGGIEPIPGGSVDIKAEEAQAKKRAGIEMQKARNQEVLSTVDDVIGKVGVMTAGPLGSFLSKVGGTSAANLEGDIKTIQANLGFDRLTQMRAESPTGGALGAVSDRELTLLTSAVANLGQKLSPSKLKENLEKVRTHLLNWQAVMDKAATESPEMQMEASPAQTEIALPPDKAQRLAELRRKAGR